MWSIRKVVVATDFSECGEAAVDRALDLAALANAELHVVHVYQLPIYPYPLGTAAPMPDLGTAIGQAAEEALAEACEPRAARGVPLTWSVRAGVAWQEILAAADEQKADLVVVGTHGRKGVPRALLGSVAEKLVRTAPMPVLTVHAGA
jgi:nucleotide-binding universal stress UspA family protein